MPDTFFRIRHYLRNLEESDLSHYNVQHENGHYTISYWGYPEYPRPNASQLTRITINQVLEEKKSMIPKYHVNDVYTFLTGNDNPMTYTVIRNNSCSLLSGREVRLSFIGYYRITITGTCQGELDIKLMNAPHQSNFNATPIHIKKVLTDDDYFSFVSIIKTDTRRERMFLNFVINQNSITNYSINGTIIVEHVK